MLHVRKKGTREEYALKQINKRVLIESDNKEQMTKEVINMHKLAKKDCPYVIRIHDHFEDSENIYLILEYAKGVDTG